MATNLEEWDEQRCLDLIREYRTKSLLWDPKDPFFFKKTLKQAAWGEISKAVGVPAQTCKHKMMILMSSFRREKAKIIHSIANEKDPNEAMYTSTWFAFKDMVFLMDKETERKRRLKDIGGGQGSDSSPPDFKKMLLKHHVQAPTAIEAQRMKRQLCNRLGKIVANKIQGSNSTTESPEAIKRAAEYYDEIASFTNFVANKMRKYSEAKKNAVQQEICQIIFKADQNRVGTNSFDKYTFVETDTDPLNKSLPPDSQHTTIKMQIESDYSD